MHNNQESWLHIEWKQRYVLLSFFFFIEQEIKLHHNSTTLLVCCLLSLESHWFFLTLILLELVWMQVSLLESTKVMKIQNGTGFQNQSCVSVKALCDKRYDISYELKVIKSYRNDEMVAATSLIPFLWWFLDNEYIKYIENSYPKCLSE